MIFKGAIEDFVYIIIGIIWLVFSIYKGSQKKKAKQSQQPQPKTTEPRQAKDSSFFDSFLENLMKEEEQSSFEPVDLNEETTKPSADKEIPVSDEQRLYSFDEEAIESLQETESKSNYFDTTDVYEISKAEPTTLKQELQTHLKTTRKKTRFDLRKAVIYSEILKRPYF